METVVTKPEVVISTKENDHASEHPGHEGYHSILVILILVLVLGGQIGLVIWKKRSYRTFQNTTLLGLWLIPFVLSLYQGFYRMLIIWSIFTGITAYLMLVKATKIPLETETPKYVYMWFNVVYKISYGTAVLGYLIVMVDMLQLSAAMGISSEQIIEVGFLLIFYGLYFGVLGRDFAELATDRIASKMGFTGKGNIPSKVIPPHTCCICGDKYEDDTVIKLNCSHMFHQWCVKGWTIIGKKNTCPYCSEKVEIKTQNPWEKTGVLWAQLLDSLRYLIVWNPIILIVINLIITVLD